MDEGWGEGLQDLSARCGQGEKRGKNRDWVNFLARKRSDCGVKRRFVDSVYEQYLEPFKASDSGPGVNKVDFTKAHVMIALSLY